jgi:hypothetical protein
MEMCFLHFGEYKGLQKIEVNICKQFRYAFCNEIMYCL